MDSFFLGDTLYNTFFLFSGYYIFSFCIVEFDFIFVFE
jgi:hypothetical protein